MNFGIENVIEDVLVDNGNNVAYTINGLRPFTNYTITVVSQNGVSDQDKVREFTRQVQVRGSTTEGGKSVLELVNYDLFKDFEDQSCCAITSCPLFPL